MSLPPRAEQHVDVPRMEQIEYAVGEHDATALSGAPLLRFLAILDLGKRLVDVSAQ
jgi:hypothetical protein